MEQVMWTVPFHIKHRRTSHMGGWFFRRLKFENQINNILKNTQEKFLRVAWILSQLDFKEFSNSKFPLQSIKRLYLFRLIKGLKNYEKLKRYLEENNDEAFLLGIYLDSNNELNIPPKRTYNYYLQNSLDKNELNSIAEKILSLATKEKIILDIEIVKKVIREKKKSHKREFKEAVKLVKKLVYPQIDLKIKNNGKFTSRDLLDVLVHVAYSHDFANNGAMTFEEMYPDKKAPSGDLMMHHFSKFRSVKKLQDMFEKILGVIFEFSKKNYNLLQHRKLNIAYDVHDICYYGDKTDDFVCGGKHFKGTTNFFKFLTCSIVVAGRRFILDVIPLHPLSNISKLIDESLDRVKKKIKIDKSLFR